MNYRVLFQHSVKLAVLIFCGALLVLFVQYYFRITEIEVVGENIALSINQRIFPENLLFFPADKISQVLLDEYPQIASVRFKKKYPHTLTIYLERRIPIAVLRTTHQALLVSSNGMVLGDGLINSKLPELLFDVPPLQHGDAIVNSQILFALQIISDFPQDVPIEQISHVDESSLQVLSRNMHILFSQSKPIGVSLDTLQTLLAGFRIKGIKPTDIDLRFDKPIIKL